MAIDIATETLLTPATTANMLPTRRRGRPVHISTIHRWMHCGIRGVRLESIRIGGALHTSVEALQRFADRLSAGDGDSTTSISTARQRERAGQAAERQLAEMGA